MFGQAVCLAVIICPPLYFRFTHVEDTDISSTPFYFGPVSLSPYFGLNSPLIWQTDLDLMSFMKYLYGEMEDVQT